MNPLRRPVRCAQWRLFLKAVLGALAWCWTAALLLAAAGIGVEKLWPLGIAAWVWIVTGLLAGLLGAAGWAFVTRPNPLAAAIEIDRRFGLKERVSTSLSLGPDEGQTPVGRAVLNDTIRRLSTLNIKERFPLSLTRWSFLPLLPAALALVVALLPPLADSRQASAHHSLEGRRQVQASAKALEQKLAQRREEARQAGLDDAEELLTKLEKATKNDLASAEKVDRKQALIKLNDLARQLEQRREKLGDSKQLQQQLNELKNLAQGPADRLAAALKQGDFRQANQELDKLREKLAQENLDPAARQQLARQLEQIGDKLQRIANAEREAAEQLKRQIADQRAAGDRAGADKLQQELDRLMQQAGQRQQMEQLAQKMGQCAGCLQAGRLDEALAGLGEMRADLDRLEKQFAEAQLMNQALDQIAQAKDAMHCKHCGGAGCKVCQVQAENGRGRGAGPRPEERGPTQAYDSAVKQKVGRGAATVVDLVDGPNLRGGVQQEINTQFERARTEAADPLTGQRLPRASQAHAKEYFDSLREGHP